ncbi:MAG: methyltransferase domain-containing protein [Nitrosarchaeum sp.]|nr:methyltransferase domain-containing protein [Nitrosarchaeum sp.]
MSNYLMQKNIPKIITIMRVKNESRWLPITFESLEKINSEIIVLDDGSTDNTLEICKKHPNVIKIIHQENLPFDETRDKNLLLTEALKKNPDFLLTLDGDEALMPGSEEILFSEISSNSSQNVFEFQVLYIWDKPNQYRTDGVFGNTWQKRLLRMVNQPHNLHFDGTQYPGNMHCPGLPQNSAGVHNPVKSNVKILHYGYFDNSLRIKKYDRYTKMDKNNTDFDNYKHILSGESKLSGGYGIKLEQLSDRQYWQTMDKTNIQLERVTPNIASQKFLFQEHIIRYLFASEFVNSKVVLDAACGTGYGSSLLAESRAYRVFGIDNSPEAIDFCKKNYSKKNLEYYLADCTNLPFTSQQFDVVTSFETIEHLKKPLKFIAEIKRILKENGIMIISTPNIESYSEKNEFHMFEYTLSDFRSMLTTYFKNVLILYQFYPSSMMIGNYDQLTSFNTTLVNDEISDETEPLYFFAICSDSLLPKTVNQNFLFKDSTLISGKTSHLKELQTLNTINEEHLKELRTHNKNNEEYIKKLKTILGQTNDKEKLEQIIFDYKKQLDKIMNSKTWKLLRKIDKIKTKF